jgi:flagellar biosynthesis protein FlhF
MNIKKYIAASSREALRRVKQEMGPDAVILRTRTLAESGSGARQVEVTAAVDYDFNSIDGIATSDETGGALLERWKVLERDLLEIKEAIWCRDVGSALQGGVAYDEALKARYINYRKFGLKPNVIRDIMKESGGADHGKGRSKKTVLRESLAEVVNRIGIQGGGDSTGGKGIYAFVGPTGVGKTTTLAKLAALNAINYGKKAALITLDTFRIAAVAQLRTYAKIMGLPLETATTCADLQRAIHKHEACDTILIDTAGRSPNRDPDIDDLRRLFEGLENIHHYLVLSATTKYRNLLLADTKFGVLPIKSYIFSKLDETQDTSSMVNFLIEKPTPVSYFTLGQEVPDDIEIASRRTLASLILTKNGTFIAKQAKEGQDHGSSCRT